FRMVFKPFTHLARQGIAKQLVNGYAQSVIAASQSSHASSILPLHKIGSNAPAKVQHTFGGAHSGRAAPGKDGQGSDTLANFYAAHTQNPDEKGDDKKYLFSRKILWSKAQHQQQQKQLLAGPQPVPIAENGVPRSRAGSFASAVDEADGAVEA